MRDDSGRELAILQVIAENDQLTQRHLARELGVAVSVANLYLRRLALRGFIRVGRLRPNRLRYLLTSKGVGEKSRLTHLYMCRTFERYREARQALRQALSPLTENGHGRVAFYGTGEAAEVAYLCLRDIGLELAEVFDNASGGQFLGRPIRSLGELVPAEFDRIVVTTFDPVEEMGARVRALQDRGASREQILTLYG